MLNAGELVIDMLLDVNEIAAPVTEFVLNAVKLVNVAVPPLVVSVLVPPKVQFTGAGQDRGRSDRDVVGHRIAELIFHRDHGLLGERATVAGGCGGLFGDHQLRGRARNERLRNGVGAVTGRAQHDRLGARSLQQTLIETG